MGWISRRLRRRHVEMIQLTVLLILIFVSWDPVWGLRNFVYQKDVSEYCRRRAVPSVFLGRSVMETNAQMLHFSKLDLPYSCFISIRTESSNNIIMVIQLAQRSDLEKSCGEFGNQLIVYEFGETFGGYWGPLPANVVNPKPLAAVAPRLYTLRTTQRTQTTTENKETAKETTEKTTTTWRPTENDDFITIDVPLVNLSASLIPGDSQVEKSFDIDDTFDLLYDVTPRKGENYETSIVPLVQFSLRRHEDTDRRYDKEARYDLDYNLGTFTPDYRLTLPVMSTRKILNRNRNLWKLKKLQRKPSRVKPNAINAPLFTTESGIFGEVKNNVLPTSSQGHENTLLNNDAAKEKISQESLTLIEDIMKSLNKSRAFSSQETKLPQYYVQVIKNISDMHHNFSAYLAPWPMYTYLPLRKTVVNYKKEHSLSSLIRPTEVISTTSTQVEQKYDTIRINDELHSIKKQKDKNYIEQPDGSLDGVFDAKKNITSASLSKTTSLAGRALHDVPTQSVVNTTNYNNFYNSSDYYADTRATKPLSDTREDAITFASTITKKHLGSLVDHESWENVVQSAPVMAVLLNQHTSNKTHNLSASNETHQLAGHNRIHGKRHIKSIPIELARPHARTSSLTSVRTRVTQVPDIQDFAQLVELPDDELSSHVALRFMRQYAGSALFNICDTNESAGYKMRHVVLFNTSRIVLALGNFSVSRMTVVLTTGQTLLGNEPACPEHGIECQVGGSRVCIDSTSACDGVPNCGAHDIYDEDRLQCGVAMGLTHNVVLAAITFLAVLLTVLYIVHYWLKRCVPKVADAFFIYTDSAENVLFLDSIMRSPTEVDNASKFLYPNSFFEENMNLYEEEKKMSIFQRMSERLTKLNIFKQKHLSCELTEAGDLQGLQPPGMRKMYSFTELEIRNMIGTPKMDEEVQTTESLEIAFLKLINLYKNDVPVEAIETATPSKQRDAVQRLELFSSLDFSSEGPGPSSRDAGQRQRLGTAEDERELHSTMYDTHVHGTAVSETSKTKETCASEGTANSKKCLRFEEQATFIMAENDQSTDATQDPVSGRHSVVLGSGSNRLIRRNINSLEAIPQDSERTDFRSFFMGKKTKKKKNQK